MGIGLAAVALSKEPKCQNLPSAFYLPLFAVGFHRIGNGVRKAQEAVDDGARCEETSSAGVSPAVAGASRSRTEGVLSSP